MITTQRVDGVFAGGFDGGVKAKDSADDERNVEGGKDDLEAEEWREGSDDGDEEGADIAKSKTGKAADEREDESLEEKLQEDIGVGGANGFTNTDFVGAFSDGYEHNIHDADAADKQGNAGDEGEHARDNREK